MLMVKVRIFRRRRGAYLPSVKVHVGILFLLIEVEKNEGVGCHIGAYLYIFHT
jgi:hypothetical protein